MLASITNCIFDREWWQGIVEECGGRGGGDRGILRHARLSDPQREALPDLELIKVDASFNNGLGSPSSLHEGNDEGGAEEAQTLVGGLDPEGSAPNEGQQAEPAVPVHYLAGPRCCDDVRDRLGEQHTPCTCTMFVCHATGVM